MAPLRKNSESTASLAREIMRKGKKDSLKDNDARKALHELQNLVEKIFSSLLDAAFIINADTVKIMDCNPAASEIFGYSRREMLGRTTDFLHVDKVSLDKFRSYLYPAVREKGHLFLPEFRMKRKDGTVFPTEHSVLPLVDDHGTRFGWVSIVRDIAERKRAEEALRESEEKYRSLASTEDSMYLVDRECRYLFMNEGHLLRFGMSLDEVVCRSYGEFHSEEDTRHFAESVERAFETGKSFQGEHKSPRDNKYFLRTFSPVRDLQGNTFAVTVVSKDITERKRAEEEIAYLAKFPAENPNPVLRLSRDGIVIYANAASDVLLGMWDCAVGSYAPQSWRDLIAQALASGQHKSIDVECAENVYSVFVAPVAEAGYVNLYGRDITDRKRSEEALKKRSAQLELIHHIQSGIPMDEDLETILILAAESIGKSFGYYKISVNIYDPETKEIEYLTGWNRTGLPLPRGHRQKLGQGLIGKAGLRKETIVANDVSKEPDYIPYHLTDTKAELIIPLLVRDKIIGVLDVQAAQVHAFSNEVVSILQSVANHIAYIIDEKKREDALRDSETRLKEAQALGRIGSWEFDLNNRTIRWSDQAYKLYERDPALGPPSVKEESAYYSPEQAKILHEYAHIAAEQGRSFEYDLQARLPSGRAAYFAATMRPVKDNNGRIVKLIGTVQDVTERKWAELEYKTIVGTAMDGFWTIDAQGRFLDTNDAYCRLIGYSREELLKMKISDIEAKEKPRETARHIRKIMEVGGDRFETRHRCKDGRVVDIEVSTKYNKESGDKLYVFLRDVTQRKQMGEALVKYIGELQRLSKQLIAVQEAERLRISQELHDEMGQALTMLRINIGSIMESLPPGYAKDIKDRLADADALTKKLLAQIHELTLDLRPHMLDDLGLVPTVRWYTERLSRRLNIQILFTQKNWKRRLTREIRTALFRIIQEALTNAAKHARAKKVRIQLAQKQKFIEVIVEDDGRGFNLKGIEKQPSRARGIGLFSMKERAALLNGECTIESRSGAGTKVRIRIPWRKVVEKN